MVWRIGNDRALCAPGSCSAAQLTFIQFLVQYMGSSYDNHFAYLNPDDGSSEFDFIVVGGGTAGSVVANRLTEIDEWKVLVLEAGDEEPFIAAVPGLTTLMPTSSLDYNYTTQPDPNSCNNQPCVWPRAKVLGGCSNFYSSHVVRGNKWDYDNWSRLGNDGWSWNNVLNYFKKSEDLTIDRVLLQSPGNHGIGGYQTISSADYFDPNAKVIMDGWKELGFREIDYNSGDNIGTSRMQYATVKGSRLSANGAFLRSIRGKRKNLTIRVNSVVTKIIIDPETKEAIGVEYKIEGSDDIIVAHAKKEIIVSAGTIDSPKLLMLSGIGPSDNLQKSGIEVIQDLPVGKNLHNHVSITPIEVRVVNQTLPFTVKTIFNDLIKWLTNHSGPLSINMFMDNIAFFKTSYEKTSAPDIQAGYIKFKHDDDTNTDHTLFPYYDGFKLTTLLLTPKSRGYLELNSSNPSGNMLIYPKYFSEYSDVLTLAEGARLNKLLAETKAFKNAGFKIKKTSNPLCDHLTYATLEYYECLTKKYTGIIGHIVGTCKMGPLNENDTVVSPRLSVKGIKNLRVIDASIMPVVPRGNTYASTLMVGEKGSDLIKEDWGIRPNENL